MPPFFSGTYEQQSPRGSPIFPEQPATREEPSNSEAFLPAPNEGPSTSPSTREKQSHQKQRELLVHQLSSVEALSQMQDAMFPSGSRQSQGEGPGSSKKRKKTSSANRRKSTPIRPEPIRSLPFTAEQLETLGQYGPLPLIPIPSPLNQQNESTPMYAFTEPTSTLFQSRCSSLAKQENLAVPLNLSASSQGVLPSFTENQNTTRRHHYEAQDTSLGAPSERRQSPLQQVLFSGQGPLPWPNGPWTVPQPPTYPLSTFRAPPPHQPLIRPPTPQCAWPFPGSDALPPPLLPLVPLPLARPFANSLAIPGARTDISASLPMQTAIHVDPTTNPQAGAPTGTSLKAGAHNTQLAGQSCSTSSEKAFTGPDHLKKSSQLRLKHSILNTLKNAPPSPPSVAPEEEAQQPLSNGDLANKNAISQGRNTEAASSHPTRNLVQPSPCLEESYSIGGGVTSVPERASHSVKPMPFQSLVNPILRQFARAESVPRVEKEDGSSPASAIPDFQEKSSDLHGQAQPSATDCLNVFREFLSSQIQASPDMLEALLALQEIWKRLQEAWPFIESVWSSLQRVVLPLQSVLRECSTEETPDPGPGIKEPAQHEHEYVPPDKLNATLTPGVSSPQGHGGSFFPATALENQECHSTTPQETAACSSPLCSKHHKATDFLPLSAVGSEACFLKKGTVQETTPQPNLPGQNETPEVDEGAAQVTTATVADAESLVAALNAPTCKNNVLESLAVRPLKQMKKFSDTFSESTTLQNPGCLFPLPHGNKSVQVSEAYPLKATNSGPKQKGYNGPRRKRRRLSPKKTTLASKESSPTESFVSSEEGDLVIDLGPKSNAMDSSDDIESDTQKEITTHETAKPSSNAAEPQLNIAALNAQSLHSTGRQYKRRWQTSGPLNETVRPAGAGFKSSAHGKPELVKNQSQVPQLGSRHEHATIQSGQGGGPLEPALSNKNLNSKIE